MDEKKEAIDGLALHFLATQTADHSLNNLRPYARKLFEKCESSLLSLNFRCQMLAEVFVPKFNQLDVVNFDVVDLCERFCKKRISNCLQENDDQTSQKTFAAFQFFKEITKLSETEMSLKLWHEFLEDLNNYISNF